MSHQHAAVSRSTGLVEAVVVIDPATVVVFAELGVLEATWPGCDLVDVTGLEVGVGWAHLEGEWAGPAPLTEAELVELLEADAAALAAEYAAAWDAAHAEDADRAEPEATP